MDIGDLFDHLDQVEMRERPLPPVRDELQSNGYTETGQSCPVEDCFGNLWEGDHSLICGSCSTVKDSSKSLFIDTDLWQEFQEDRPRYRNSNARRQVGSFNHEWVERDEIDTPISLVDPEDFYR